METITNDKADAFQSAFLDALKRRGDSMAAGKKKGGVNSLRAMAIVNLMEVLGEHYMSKGERSMPIEAGKKAYTGRYNARFKYWLGRTRKLATHEIFARISICRRARKPGALFNSLLTKDREKEVIPT